MPWCEPCEAFYNPNTLRADGCCPRCGAQVGDPAAVATELDDENPDDLPSRPAWSTPGVDGRQEDFDEDGELVARVPWHFWVGVVAMVVYLGWRLLQGVIWLF